MSEVPDRDGVMWPSADTAEGKAAFLEIIDIRKRMQDQENALKEKVGEASICWYCKAPISFICQGNSYFWAHTNLLALCANQDDLNWGRLNFAAPV